MNASMMFRYGGNGPWGQIVRHCLVCMYKHGATPNQAHWYCYSNADQRTSRFQSFGGWSHAITSAFVIDMGQVFLAISSNGTNIQAVGPWEEFLGLGP